MSFLYYIKRSLDPQIKTIYNKFKNTTDKDFFKPYGTQIFAGRQGSGKTLSAVRATLRTKKDYPKAILVSNLAITGYIPLSFTSSSDIALHLAKIDPQKEYIYFKDIDQLTIALTEVNNTNKGVIYLIDEIHTYFNSLESKNIPMWAMTEISQQRKQRKLIIGTSQVFMRVSKAFREQCDNIIMCKTFLGHISLNSVYDAQEVEQDYEGKLIGRAKKRVVFAHDQKLYDTFDTFQKVVSANEQIFEINKPLELKQKQKRFFT